ncbi:hypothetical protein GCM10009680_29130 [Streptomyces yatensis]|uniref:Uncharacterized protein n=1 Tax=Streptomyces yatensis TaxID=155177 RepID=A0ABN2HGZ0_9ACTN
MRNRFPRKAQPAVGWGGVVCPYRRRAAPAALAAPAVPGAPGAPAAPGASARCGERERVGRLKQVHHACVVIPLARAHRPGIGGQLCFRDTSRASADRRNRDGGLKGGLRPHRHRIAVLRVQGGARLLGSGPIARGQVAAIAGARKGTPGWGNVRSIRVSCGDSLSERDG